jgi:hypothetical protein
MEVYQVIRLSQDFACDDFGKLTSDAVMSTGKASVQIGRIGFVWSVACALREGDRIAHGDSENST